MRQDGKIDYVEQPGGDLPATKAFYETALGWRFTDYGPSYAAFSEGLDGGFDSDGGEAIKRPMVILYADDLEAMEARIRAAGGTITRAIQPFPGGRRFHFKDPAGNELGVWGDPTDG